MDGLFRGSFMMGKEDLSLSLSLSLSLIFPLFKDAELSNILALLKPPMKLNKNSTTKKNRTN